MVNVIGFGALNMDLIYELHDPAQLEELGISFEPGREIVLPDSLLDRYINLLDRCATLKARCGGGSAANTVSALSKLGFSTAMVGRVGGDTLGEELLRGLEGVDTTRVKRVGRSGTCLVLLGKGKDRFIMLFPNANDQLCDRDVDIDDLCRGRYLHLSSFSGDRPMEVQKTVVKSLRNKVMISMDPGEPYARKGLAAMKPLIEGCEIFFATDHEVELLTGRTALEGCRLILDLGPSIVVCKRGESGSYVISREGSFEVGAVSADRVVDTTGAGDVYDAGFLAGRLLGIPLEECARFAAIAAARSLSGFGRSSYPDRGLLEAFLAAKR